MISIACFDAPVALASFWTAGKAVSRYGVLMNPGALWTGYPHPMETPEKLLLLFQLAYWLYLPIIHPVLKVVEEP